MFYMLDINCIIEYTSQHISDDKKMTYSPKTKKGMVILPIQPQYWYVKMLYLITSSFINVMHFVDNY